MKKILLFWVACITLVACEPNQPKLPVTLEAVDLGLSVNWANMNVGATAPEEFGFFFAWGETKNKKKYDWRTYKWMKRGKTDENWITKYTYPDGNTSAIWYDPNDNFIGDNLTTLDSLDDAAHMNWKGKWRMPTQEEFQELIDNCNITRTYDYNGTGVSGIIFTSKKPGYTDKSIFFSTAGRIMGENDSKGAFGCYWTASLSHEKSSAANDFYFDVTGGGPSVWGITNRSYGLPVRAVLPKEEQ